MQISAELYEFVIKVVDDRVREIKVAREDFNALFGNMPRPEKW
ncbi:hypothetical protein BLFGPEAP_00948 [Candidatus Methanoperedenaceae archaeon GB50]|nr:hypothetical protein BLFGPEAP_00948 [Candidatus Methanoperedenaceae archaeon GB50]